MTPPPTPWNVGISIMPTANSNIWNSGLDQNIAFLVQTLRLVPGVGKVFLLNGGDVDELPPGLDFSRLQVPLVRPHEVTHELHVAIEFGATLSHEWVRRIRALGAKVATLLVGHTFLGHAERPVFGQPGGTEMLTSPRDQIWTLPHHMATSAPMLRTTTRVPVHEAAYLWAGDFIDAQAAQARQAGLSFGFEPNLEPRTRGWRVGIFEPNISVGKTSFIPMLACDHAYRLEPRTVELMMVMNSFHLKEHATFNRFALNLDLTRASKASYEPRLPFVDCMARSQLDAVVAHHWEWGLNNAYYDALHAGYPFIHNSDFLQADGAGLYYSGFEAAQAGDLLRQAWHEGADFWAAYRERAQRHLRLRHPTAPGNVAAYARLLAGLFEAPV